MSCKGLLRTFSIGLRNIVIGGNLISLQLITDPRQFVGTISTQLFYHKALTGKGRLDQKNPGEVLAKQGQYYVNIDTTAHFWGNDPSYTKDFITLCVLAQQTKPKQIFEIGTLSGVSALHFAMNTEEDAKIYTLDLPLDGSIKPSLSSTCIDEGHRKAHSRLSKYCFDGSAYASKIQCLFGDSAAYDFSPFYGIIDLFFIDGAHSYSYVKSDTLNALRCVRPGGLILWHDYGRMGVNEVTKWLHEFAETKKVYSVPGSSLAYHILDE